MSVPADVAALKERVEKGGRVWIPMPPPTCPKFDAALKNIAPVAREARRLCRVKLDPETDYSGDFAEFVSMVDDLLCDLPDALEELRALNAELRDAALTAIDQRNAFEDALDEALQEPSPSEAASATP